MFRGERLIKISNSWFSTKSILVEFLLFKIKGKATFFLMGI